MSRGRPAESRAAKAATMERNKIALRFYSVFLFCSFALAALPPFSHAVPANPKSVDAMQADGTTVQVSLKGDEYYHWHEDRGGYTILKDTATKNWVYAERDASGSLRAGRNKVGAADPAALGIPKRLLDTPRMSAARTRRTKVEASSPFRVSSSVSTVSGTQSTAPARTPILTGTMKNLVILAQFSDVPFVHSQAEFDNLFNQLGYTASGAVGSVRDYYKEVSYGKLDVQSVVSVWVTLPHTQAYYGANTGPDGTDANDQQMALDAVVALHNTGFDFSQVDGNHDGLIDGLDIIHSGFGEEWGNDPDTIWSHKWELPYPVTYNGVTMSDYHTEGEIRGWSDTPSSQGITRIGVIAHETGHFLGLPDLYDTSYQTYGIGDYCIMAGGSWNGDNGNSPAHMSAWCKKTLGWVTPTQLTTIGTKTLPSIENNSAAMYLLRDAAFPSNEYFLVENRQGVGFDAALPGTYRGMLIWHISEDQVDNSSAGVLSGGSYTPTAALHFLVDLEEASGTQYLQKVYSQSVNPSDDRAYFRAGNATSFSDITAPNSKSYFGTPYPLKLPISAISATGNPMTFYLGTTDITPPATVGTVNDGLSADIAVTGSLTQLSANWTASSDPETGISGYWYAVGTSAGGTDVADWTYNGLTTSVTRAGLSLTDGITYYFSVKAVNGVGVYSGVKSSNGQTVNTNSPTDIPYVNDGTGADIQYVSSLQHLSANWGTSSHVSGITAYEYAIGTTRGGVDARNWTSVGLNTSVTTTGLTFTEGLTYYFAVRALDGLGFYSASSVSDGQKVDTTSPTARVEISSDLPAKTGRFYAKLIVNESNALSGTPVLKLAQGCGGGAGMDLAYASLSTWTASAFIESYLSTGTACFTFSATDLAGNTGTVLTSGGTFNVDPVVSGVTGGIVSNSDGASVTVPPGAYGSGLYISISTLPASRETTADAASYDSIKIRSVDLAREFKARNSVGAPITDFSSHPLTITLGYPDANDDGRIDGDFIKEDLAWLYYMDEVAGKWTPLAGVSRHPLANTLSAEVSHFSVYSVRASGGSDQGLSGLKAYPNPCDLRTVPALVIAGIPVDAVSPAVFIYNEAGELVRTLSPGDGIDGVNAVHWDGKLKGGARAASGLYLYLVRTSNYGKGSGKFFIVW